jgi:hypothetical protein
MKAKVFITVLLFGAFLLTGCSIDSFYSGFGMELGHGPRHRPHYVAEQHHGPRHTGRGHYKRGHRGNGHRGCEIRGYGHMACRH